MNKQTLFTILLSLVAVAGLAKTKTAEVKADSLLLFVQAGDSCMQQLLSRGVCHCKKTKSAHGSDETRKLPL